MASTDWTSTTRGSVSFAIIADGTAPSPPDVMQVTTGSSGGQAFENITGGTFKNSRMTGWVNQASSNGTIQLRLGLRSQNSTYIAAPATLFNAEISSLSATDVRVKISAIVNGVVTEIVSTDVTSVNGTPVSTWQQYQFSSFNSGPDILLRVSQWNGAAFVPIADAAVAVATYPTLDAAGGGRFGGDRTAAGSLNIDDVAFYSLT